MKQVFCDKGFFPFERKKHFLEYPEKDEELFVERLKTASSFVHDKSIKLFLKINIASLSTKLFFKSFSFFHKQRLPLH
jgi:hypothetical protein